MRALFNPSCSWVVTCRKLASDLVARINGELDVRGGLPDSHNEFDHFLGKGVKSGKPVHFEGVEGGPRGVAVATATGANGGKWPGGWKSESFPITTVHRGHACVAQTSLSCWTWASKLSRNCRRRSWSCSQGVAVYQASSAHQVAENIQVVYRDPHGPVCNRCCPSGGPGDERGPEPRHHGDCPGWGLEPPSCNRYPPEVSRGSLNSY